MKKSKTTTTTPTTTTAMTSREERYRRCTAAAKSSSTSSPQLSSASPSLPQAPQAHQQLPPFQSFPDVMHTLTAQFLTQADTRTLIATAKWSKRHYPSSLTMLSLDSWKLSQRDDRQIDALERLLTVCQTSLRTISVTALPAELLVVATSIQNGIFPALERLTVGHVGQRPTSW